MNLETRSLLSSNYRKHTATNPLQRALIDRFQRKVVAEIVALSPRSFLDAGCGEGFVARRVLDALPGVELVGCDVSEPALAVAAQLNSEARFIAGSVIDLPFADRSFDVVGCFGPRAPAG
jgi:23S rRNA (guanine745-N1)-methyltransferase